MNKIHPPEPSTASRRLRPAPTAASSNGHMGDAHPPRPTPGAHRRWRVVGLQCVRRFVQGCVLLIVVSVALLSLYAHYRAAGAIDDAQLMAGLRGEAVTQRMHPYLDRLDDPQAFLDGNQGTLWSMRLLGVSVTDPLAAAEMMAASKHIHWPLVVSILAPVVLTLLLGKVFCSWICPGYLLFEVTGKLRRLLRFAEIEPGAVDFSHRNKYVFLVVWLVLAVVFSAPFFALIYPPAVISRAIHAWIFGTELAGMLVLLGVIIAFELFVSPRWWCRTMCPGGALYGLIGRVRPLRVKLRREACTGCRGCIPVCEAGINPITQSQSIECDNCGVCIHHCGDGALYYGIVLPKLSRTTPAGPSRTSRRDRRLPPAAITQLFAILVVLVCAKPAAAHHILGLPHYSYKENYPQRPTLEYPATTGPYDILLMSYPGHPKPGKPANLAFYIKNRETNAVYAAPVTVRILRTSTFGDSTVVMPSTERRPFDNEHKFQFAFPDDGEYVVELSVDVEGKREVIPFLMVAGEPTATTSFLIAAAFALVLVFVVIRAVQKKRRRRDKRRRPDSTNATPGAAGFSPRGAVRRETPQHADGLFTGETR